MSALMDEYNWLKKLTELAKQDSIYQQYYDKIKEAESAFLSLFSTLSESQQEVIGCYLSDCEELDYRLMQLSYELGRKGL